jgi:hypothetical protein
MTQPQIGKVWLIVSALLLYYSLNSWIVSQGGNEIFGAKLIVSNKVLAAMIAIPICAVLLTLASSIGACFARRGRARWHERIPTVGFDVIDTGSTEGRIYQGAMLAVFSLVLAAAMAYFWVRFLSATVMLNDGSRVVIGSVWDWSRSAGWNDPARICSDFNRGLADPCIGNATVLPGLEPAVLTIMAALALLWHWHAVVWRPGSRAAGIKPE